MKAVHVFWSAPKGNQKTMEQFEVDLLAISAIAFRKTNQQKPLLFTDNLLLNVLRSRNLTDLWEKIDTDVLSALEGEPGKELQSFPAAAKMYVLKEMTSPLLMIDVDAVIYEMLPDLTGFDVVCAHRETDEVHSFYPKSTEVEGSPELDHSPIFNVSLLWINHEEFRKEFAKKFFELIKKRNGKVSDLQLMTFAEQRLAGHLAQSMRLKATVFRGPVWSCENRAFIESDETGLINTYHHLWHQKKNLMKVPQLQAIYIEELLRTIEEKLPGISSECKKKLSCT